MLAAAARLLRDSPAAPLRPGARSRSPSPPPTTALRRSGSRGRRGWMERPPRGRAQPWCCRETPPAESPRSEPIPPLPSPKRSPLYRHRDDYIFSARARLSPQSFHLKEETGGQESAIRHPRLLPRGSYRLPSSSFSKPLSLLSARSCPLPGRLILPGSWEKAKLLFPLQGWSGLRAERFQGPLGDERTARCGRQWNRRGRAEQPRVCRERGEEGEGEAPGTSMSRLNIYPHITVLCCYPPRLPRPGRAGRGSPGVPKGVQGSRTSCCGRTVSPPVWGRRMWVGAPRTL